MTNQSTVPTHDQNFKNLILDHPRQARAFFAAEEAEGRECRLWTLTSLRDSLINLGRRLTGSPLVQRKGTRITVELILEKIAAGESFEDILTAHPNLTPEKIRTAIRFAAVTLKADVICPPDNSVTTGG